MARRNTQPMEQQIPFPVLGIDLQRGFLRQNPQTCVDARNVRSFDSLDRARGGSRGGLDYVYSGATVDETKPIQHVTTFVSGDTALPSLEFGHSIYALTADNGFGQAGSDGVSDWTAGAATGYSFACSCWDDNNNVYVATVNTTAGVAQIRKVDLTGNVLWTKTGVTVETGNVRFLAGMVVVGSHLYVARRLSSSSCRITKLSTSDGATVADAWKTNTDITNLIFLANSCQVLAKIGDLIGTTGAAGASTNGFFIVINTVTGAFSQVSIGVAKSSTPKVTVVSNGTTFFYAVCPIGTNPLRAFNTGAVEQWNVNASPLGLCYDKSNGYLLGCAGSSPCVTRYSLANGSVAETTDLDGGAVTALSWIDTDGNGLYTGWVDGVASNDTIGFDDSWATVWGETTRANTTHTGASMNKGKFLGPIVAGVRATHRFVVSNGALYSFDEDGPTFVTGSQVWDAFFPVFSAQNGNDLFFVDGTTYKYYDAATNTVRDWATDLDVGGTLPFDAFSKPAKLICTWNGRTVLAIKQNFYMSEQYNPFGFNYSPNNPAATDAFAGNADLAGFVGAFINCLVPYDDDNLIFLCDHEIWRMAGDPGAGGGLSRMAAGIGGAFGNAYAFDPEGLCYFMGTDGRIYKLVPGSPPVPASQPIDSVLKATDLSANFVNMEWDIDRVGLAVWLAPIDASVKGEAFFWEKRVNAWWRDSYATAAIYPMATHTFDGDAPGDRRILLGGRDGKLRVMNPAATTDTSQSINSYVVIGPFRTPMLDDVLLEKALATFGSGVGLVTYSVYRGRSAEEALAKIDAGTPDRTGTLTGGRNRVVPVRLNGFVFYIKFSSVSQWALEHLAATFRSLGALRRWA